MKKIILGMVLGLSAIAHADPGTRYTTQYKCTFTEPFINVEYDSYSKSVTVNAMGEQLQTISKVALLKDAKTTDLHVVDKAGKTILTIKNEAGSDGMSDNEYLLTGVYEGIVGGCNLAFKKIAD